MKLKTSVYLRADGNSKMGLGHVHRLLALAEILSYQFDCIFVIRNPLAGIRSLILNANIKIIEIPDRADIREELKEFKKHLIGKEIVVLDGYFFDTEYQANVKSNGSLLVCIDDVFKTHFVSDVIINPAGGVTSKLYSMESYTKLIAGPRYAFLKEPFRSAAKEKIDRPLNNSLLICMGGADPDNHTLSMLGKMLPFNFESITIITGEAYLHGDLLQREVTALNQSVRILNNLTSSRMAQVMSECSVAICSASGISYEYSSVGGELYVLKTADNQQLLYTFLNQSGLTFPLEEFRTTKRNVLSAREQQKKIFDGDSDKRLAKVFNELDFKLNVTIRKAVQEDLLILFKWANDPELRAQSFNSKLISLEDHTQWFMKKLEDVNCHLLIFEYKNVPIATARVDVADVADEATISYSLDKKFRGLGWGSLVLGYTIKALDSVMSKPIKVVGYVKQDNITSNTIFKKLGFAQYKTTLYPHSYKYELLKP